MLSFHTLDVFTDQPYQGNPLAVVLGAEALDDDQMQTVAREFNLSETIFVLPPRNPDNTARVRIFFPTGEIPFAGHPTIGCAVLLAQLRNGDGDFDDWIRLEEEAGLVAVAVQRRDGATAAKFVAPVIPRRRTEPISEDIVAQALGTPEEAIGMSGHAPCVYEGGPAFLFVPIMDRFELSAAEPCEPEWSDLMQEAGVDSAYVYTRDNSGNVFARMFAPGAGIAEDPATGSAAAILAAVLHDADDLSGRLTEVTIFQGVEMGRPSTITMTARVEDRELVEVRIGGSAVPIGSGRLIPPPSSDAA